MGNMLFYIVVFALALIVGFVLPMLERKYLFRLRLTQKENDWTRVRRGANLTHLWVAARDVLPSDVVLYKLSTRLKERTKRTRSSWRLTSRQWYRDWLRGRWYIVKRDGEDRYVRKEQIRDGEPFRDAYVARVRSRRFEWKWDSGPSVSSEPSS